MPPETASEIPPTISQIASKIAADFRSEYFGTGPRAALRRMSPENLARPELQNMLANHVPDHWLGNGGMADWALLVHCLALGSPDHLANAQPLGKALHEAQFSESRLARLLQADRSQLNDLLPRACRFLVAKNESLHAPSLIFFIRALSSQNADDVMKARTKIAQDFYRATRNSQAPASVTQD